MEISKQLAKEFNAQVWQISTLIEMLDEGNTIPFIARYRKEKHGSLDDQKIREIADRLEQLRGIEKRKEEIITSLTNLEVYNDDLAKAIQNASSLSELEDIYRPYRPKRRTRAIIAREKGLEPLADAILLQAQKGKTPEELAAAYLNEEKGVATIEDAIAGAQDIIAEKLSDDATVRGRLKNMYRTFGAVHTAVSKDPNPVYEMYFDHREPMRSMPGYRVLAMDRGEKEGALKVHLDVNEENAVRLVEKDCVRNDNNPCEEAVKAACHDAFERLIEPSLVNELRSELTEAAQKEAIQVFASNLKSLLMQQPLRKCNVLALDPGIRNGCKVAVVDQIGRVLDTGVIFPLPAQGRVVEAKTKIKNWIRRWNVEVVAIGNGTAGRETEQFFCDVMKEMESERTLSYAIVNEAGASVYSASKLGAEEFPDMDVNVRSAVSLARRLQDPLAELVKIDPKSIGVGQYQHDLKESELDHALSGIVEECVNMVGVDLNTASQSLLSHVSGISASLAKGIVEYREKNGCFDERKQLLKVPRLGARTFEQCAGFLRIPEAKDPIENTGIHPESYQITKALLKKYGLDIHHASNLAAMLDEEALQKAAEEMGIGYPTLKDIVAELAKPGRDPRDELPPPLLRKDVLDMKDLYSGMELMGTVRNVTDFGTFVDIGVHQDGLIHVSEYPNGRNGNTGLKVGTPVKVWVKSVDMEKKRIALTMRNPGNKIHQPTEQEERRS